MLSWACALGAVLLLGTACSSRQADAEARARDGVAQVVDLLGTTPREGWSRPSAAVREQLAASTTQYRVLRTHDDGSTSIAVWRVDTGADPFTDDTPRVGTACARVGPRPGEHRVERCPPRLAAEVSPASVDWSVASAAHDAASFDISRALSGAQEEVRRGRVTDRAELGAYLDRQGVAVEPRPGADPLTLHATLRRTASAERVDDTSRSISATSCSTLTFSIDPAAPFYSDVDGRPCARR